MTKSFSVVFIILIVSITIQAQIRIEKKPAIYDDPYDTISNTPGAEYLENRSDKPWYVISDRNDNWVYEFENGNKIIDTIHFGEKLAVMKSGEDGSRLRVAYEADIYRDELPDNEKLIGWMDSDKLLLWEKCMKNQDHGIDKKAMILFNYKSAMVEHNQTGKVTTDVKIFKSPSSSSVYFLHRGTFEFFPVYKSDGKYLLIGRDFQLNNRKVSNANYNNYDSNYGLIGWIDTLNVSQWNHRLAWEINWNPEAVAERMRNKSTEDGDTVGVLVLATAKEAEDYRKTNRKNVTFNPPNAAPYQELEISKSLYRVPGPQRRFPILDIKKIQAASQGTNKQPVKVGSIGPIKTGNGEISYEDLYTSTDQINNLKNINIIFVIDATESMVEYKSSIIGGIKNAQKSINDFYAKHNSSDIKSVIKYGCVLYRDFHIQHTIQTCGSRLDTDTEYLIGWIDENLSDSVNKIKRKPKIDDNEYEEAMYYGMKEALEDYKPDPDESNYMILLGDCGDHQLAKDPSGKMNLKVDQDSLVNKLMARNINLLAFQVHYDNPKQYDANKKFQEQLNSILSKLGNNKVMANIANPNLSLSSDSAFFMKRKFLPCKEGTKMDTSEMRSIIANEIEQINKDVNKNIRDFRIIMGDIDGIEDPYATYRFLQFALSQGWDSTTYINIAKYGLIYSYETGYTVLRCNGYEYDNYLPVVLMKKGEFNDILDAFQTLSIEMDADTETQKLNLASALEHLFPTYFDYLDEDELYDMEVGMLLHKITGLDIGDKYQSITINYVKTNALSTEISGFVKDMNQTYKRLNEINKEIYHNKYPGMVKGRGIKPTRMYYIPVEIFPHK